MMRYRGGVVFLAALLVVGCGERSNEAVEWRAPELRGLHALLLRYRGPATGCWVVEFVRSGGPAPQTTATVDLAGGRRLSQESFGFELSLLPPVTEPTTVRVRPAAGGSGETVSFDVDPVRELNAVLAPIDALKGARLKDLCTDVTRARGTYGKAVTADGLGAFIALRRDLGETLERHGVSRSALVDVRGLVNGLARAPLAPAADLTARLLPLRLIEALLCQKGGPFCPWGSVARAVDIRVEPVQSWEPSAGWTSLGSVNLCRMMPAPNVPDLQVEAWQWMATPYMMKALQEQGAVNLVYTNFVKSSNDVLGRPEDYRSVVTATLTAPPGTTVELPPRAASLCLVMRAFTRETVVRVRLNDGPDMLVVNCMFDLAGQTDLGEYDPCLYRLRVAPELVRAGQNTVTVGMEAMPHQEPPLALRVREVALQVR